MDTIKLFIEKIMQAQIISSIIIVIISLVLYRIIIYILGKGEEKSKVKAFSTKKSKTYFKLIKSIIRYVFLIVTVLIILQVNGVNVGSMLAGVGILSVIVGLAVQDALKDIIRGTSILSDDYFSVGDVIKYGEIEGKVVSIGIKTTKIEELKTNNVISIANRNIEQIAVVSNYVYINIPVPHEVPVEEAEKVIEEINSKISKNNYVNRSEYIGVNDLDESCIKYLIKIDCKTEHRLQVRRDALRVILLEMDNNGIEIPHKQIDVHQK